MKISTKGRYGLRAMLDIAQDSSGKAVSLKDIAKRQDISENYLEQVFSVLKKAKLVDSVKGAGGGYRLINHPSEISVKEILSALEGDMSVVEKKAENTSEMATFLYEVLWQEIDKKISSLTDQTTLQGLINEYANRTSENSTMYYI